MRGKSASAGTGATIIRPGADSSGFVKPSAVRPYADHGARKSSDGSSVPFWSTAPTVMTNGSLPGAYVTPLGPSGFP